MRTFEIIQPKISEDRQDVIWYDGAIAITHQGDWTGLLSAIGSIRIAIGEDIYVAKGGSNPNFIEDISKHIKSDQDIYDLIEKDLIEFDNNSWFEVTFENTATNEVISDVLDAGSYDDAIQGFKDYFSYLIEKESA